MIKLIVFDIGGVIIRFDERDYIRYIAKKQHLSYTKLSKVLLPLIDKMELGHLTVRNMEELVKLKFKLKDSTMEWETGFKKLARPNPKVRSLATRLAKRNRLVLLTNVSESRYVIIKEKYLNGIKPMKVFASCYLNIRKPDPRIYKRVLRDMRVKPEEAVFIDNMLINVKGARRVGMHGIWFKSYPQLVRDLKKLKVL